MCGKRFVPADTAILSHGSRRLLQQFAKAAQVRTILSHGSRRDRPHSSQWSRCVAAGAASLRSLAHWASASLHRPLGALGSAPLPKEPFGLCALVRRSNTKKHWSLPPPKAPFLKGGGGAPAPTGDCRIPRRFGKHTLPAVYPALAEVRTILSHGLRHDSPTVRNGRADKTILSPLRGQLLCQRSRLDVCFRAPSEYEARWSSPRPNAPFLKGGGGARAPTGDCRK